MTEKVVTIKPRWWDSHEPYEVTLIPMPTYGHGEVNEWEVKRGGKTLGWVGRYTGSLDRKAGRLRIPGKDRILWHLHTDRRSSGLYEYTSRADAIRYLADRADRIG